MERKIAPALGNKGQELDNVGALKSSMLTTEKPSTNTNTQRVPIKGGA